MTNPRIAVIGAGYWGKNLVRNFSELGVLKTICDTNPELLRQMQTKYTSSMCTDSLKHVLDDPQIDAIAIATPAATHSELATAAIAAGKDVFVEKPLSLNVEDGERLVEAATDASRILMVGHILQYHPAIEKLKELVNSGGLGRVVYLYSNRLNMGKFRTEENILWSFAPHDISVMLALLDEEPNDVVSRGADFVSDGVADVTMSHFSFPSGAQAHIFVSWLHPFKEQRLVVVGSEKMAVFEDTAADKLLVYPHGVQWINRVPTAVKAEAEVVEISDAEPLRAECQHFIDSVRTRSQPLTDGREALRVLRVLTTCERYLTQQTTNATTPTNPTLADSLFFAHETATIDKGSQIGEGSKIWHYSHIMDGARLGHGCVVGQNCCISSDVVIGSNVRIQNNVSIYTGTQIEDDVFLGPSCVLTNVTNPRSQINRHSLYEKTILRRGATVGANATIVCGVEIGRYAFIAAGATVTKDVPDYALIVGTPGRQAGWISRHGHGLPDPGAEGIMTCPESSLRYKLAAPNVLRCLDLDENTRLPEEQATGKLHYGSFKDAKIDR